MSPVTPELEALKARTRALQDAAATATVLAVRNGATDQLIARKLADAQRRLSHTHHAAAPDDELADARFALRCRQEICRAMASVALDHDVDNRELTDALASVIETSSRMHKATTIADLGFTAAA